MSQTTENGADHWKTAAQCAGKEIFRTYTMAASIAAKMRRRHCARFRAYRCKYCQRYHVGETEHNVHRTPRNFPARNVDT